MIVYYAHCMSLYGTPQEERDIATLRTLGWKVSNPNTPAIDKRVRRWTLELGKGAAMDRVFRPLVERADIFAFRALPDGAISSGVVREMEWAEDLGIPIIELPSSVKRRKLSLALTREYLREAGQR